MRIKIGLGLTDCKSAITVLPFDFVEEIEYKKELNGETKELVRLGRLSGKIGGFTLLGAYSDNHGIKRTSAYIFECGRLAVIADMNEGSPKNIPSHGLNIFTVEGIKCGVIVGSDMFDVDVVKALSLCGCSAIIDLYADFLTELNLKATDFYAHVFGLDFVCVGKDCAHSCTADGRARDILSVKSGGIFDMPCKRLFRNTNRKKAGIV